MPQNQRGQRSSIILRLVVGLGISVCLLAISRRLVVGQAPIDSRFDLTFCSLDSLRQFGRRNDVVAIAAGTTSWNVGNQRLDWFRLPDRRHPFIVQNLYRVKNDTFEQIGESWAKHGFFALSNSQCGNGCNDLTDGTQLGVDCTDTYGSSTNAAQEFFGPRSEINPWTGEWSAANSHLTSAHPHDPVEHLLDVHDRDLDPQANQRATYFLEGYYVHYQDQNPMNNAAWKAVTIRSGSPGTNWVFGMSGAQDMPTSGFALSAWAGARQTFLAAQIPTIKGTSLDGRCMLAAKATNTGGQWHYVYALLNIDLASQAGAFSVPVLGANVTDANFHSPEHHNEPLSGGGNALQMNDAWAINVSPSGVLWSTTMNPLHWGDVYTFSFTSTKAPVDGEVTVSLFRNNGSPLKGVTVVPGK